MECEKRRVERKRADQLVYAELAPENGSVLMNLSEDGCGFQSIAPVLGREVHFTFSLGTGQVIEGDARVAWVDDTGKLGGLQFTNRSPELRNHIRTWLAATIAAEDLRSGTTLAAATTDSEAKRRRQRLREEARLQLKAKALGWKLQKLDDGSDLEQDTRSSKTPSGTVAAGNEVRGIHEEGTIFASQPNSAEGWKRAILVALAAVLLAIAITGRRQVGYVLMRLGSAMAGDRPVLKSAPPKGPVSDSTLTGDHVMPTGVVAPIDQEQGGAKIPASGEAQPAGLENEVPRSSQSAGE